MKGQIYRKTVTVRRVHNAGFVRDVKNIFDWITVTMRVKKGSVSNCLFSQIKFLIICYLLLHISRFDTLPTIFTYGKVAKIASLAYCLKKKEKLRRENLRQISYSTKMASCQNRGVKLNTTHIYFIFNGLIKIISKSLFYPIDS